MSQKTILIALKEASRKIDELIAGRVQFFSIETKRDADGAPVRKLRRRPTWVETRDFDCEWKAEEFKKTLEEVLTLIRHVEVPVEMHARDPSRIVP